MRIQDIRSRIVAFALCLCGLAAPGASAAPQLIEGVWDYYFVAEPGSIHEFVNKSHEQGLYKVLSDGTEIYRVRTRAAPFYRKAPLAGIERSGPGFERNLAPYYPAGDKRQAELEAFASSLFSGLATVDEVVDKTATWVRDNVRYSLGTAIDPLGVKRSGLAFCEGYASISIYLLRAAGIEARGLTCDVPAGKGWGFSGEGGGHAFLEYYYPGYGWVSIDPQATCNFTDPYHLIGADAAKIVRELGSRSSLCVMAPRAEPAKWQTFLWANDGSAESAPLVLLRLPSRDKPAGAEGVAMSVEGELASPRALEPPAIVRDGWRSGSDALMNYDSLAYYLRAAPEDLGREAVIVAKGKDFLARRSVALPDEGRIVIDLESSEGTRVLYLYGADLAPYTGPLALVFGDRRYDFAATRGELLIAAEGPFEARIGDEARSFAAEGARDLAFLVGGGAAPTVEELMRKAGAKPGETGAFCLLRDECGLPDAQAFDSLAVYNERGEKVGAAEAGKPYAFLRLRPGTRCVAVASAGNRHVRRSFAVPASGIATAELSLEGARFKRITHENDVDPKISFYEYLAPRATIRYQATDGVILLDAGDGTFFLSDSPDGRRLARWSGASGDFAYAPGAIGAEDYLAVRRFLYQDGDSVVARASYVPARVGADGADLDGRVRGALGAGLPEGDRDFVLSCYSQAMEDGSRFLRNDLSAAERERLVALAGSPIRGGSAWLRDRRTGKADSVAVGGEGWFAFPGAAAGDEYDLVLQWRGVVLTRALGALSSGCTLALLDSTAPRAFVADPPSSLNVLFPPGEGKTAGSLEVALRASGAGPALLALDSGEWFVGKGKSPYAALVLPSSILGSMPDPLILRLSFDPSSQNFALNRGFALVSYYGGGGGSTLLAFLDAEGSAVGNASLRLSGPGPEARATTDAEGLAFFGALAPGLWKLDYAGQAGRRAVYLETEIEVAADGPAVATIDLRKLGAQPISLKPGDSLFRAEPRAKGDELAFAETRLPLDKSGRCLLYLAEGSYLFLRGDARQPFELAVKPEAPGAYPRYRELPPGAGDPFEAYSKAAAAAFPDSARLVLRARNGKDGAAFAGRQVSLSFDGAWARRSLGRDGFLAMRLPEGAAELRARLEAPGLYLERTIALAASGESRADLDLSASSGATVAIKNASGPLALATASVESGKLRFRDIPLSILKNAVELALPPGSYWARLGRGGLLFPLVVPPRAAGKPLPLLTLDEALPPDQASQAFALLAAQAPEAQAAVIRLRSGGKPLAAESVMLRGPERRTRVALSAGSWAIADGLEPGRYSLSCAFPGAYLRAEEKKLAGPEKWFLELEALPVARVSLKNSEGLASAVSPRAAEGAIALDETPLRPSASGTLALYSSSGTTLLKLGRSGALVETRASKAVVALDGAAPPDQLPIWEKLYSSLLPEEGFVLLRLARRGAPLARAQLKLTLGDRNASLSTGPEGFVALRGAAGKGYLVEYAEPGIYALRAGTFAARGGAETVSVTKAPSLTATVKAAKPASAAVTLYAKAKLDASGRLSYQSRIELRTDAAGALALVLPPGDYVLEARKGTYVGAKAVDGKTAAIVL